MCACGLLTTNTDSPSEVWLACVGSRRNMNEFTPVLHFLIFYFPTIPTSFLLSKCCLCYFQSHFSSGVCVCICAKLDGRPTLARGSFLWQGQYVSRRLAGVSGASSSFQLHSLKSKPVQTGFATNHWLVISRITRTKSSA